MKKISARSSLICTHNMASDEKSNQSSFTCKLTSSTFSHFLLFVFGISIGFMIGFYELQTLPFFSSTFFFSSPPSSPPPQPPTQQSTMNFSMKETGMRSLQHNMSDEELFTKASMMGEIAEYLPKGYVPKVAFLFLARGHLPFAPLWELFFHGHKGFYSIYVHAHPLYKDPFPDDSVFHGRFITSQEVQWGSLSIVDAERRLLANALLDYSNQRFVLISEACIPLFNFTTVYEYIIKSNLSFLDSYNDPGREGQGRYNDKMSPKINITNWRKGEQWFELDKELAIQIVSDAMYYDLFRLYCIRKRRPTCFNEEHYLPTLANIKFPGLIANRTLTYTNWSKGGIHPASFEKEDISEEFIHRIRFESNCSYNGNETRACFLFARKMMGSTLEPLLQIATHVLGF